MHRSVLLREVVDLLALPPGGRCIDGTAGSGGHARALLEALGEQGRLLAIDRDPEALERTRRNVGGLLARCALVQANFSDLRQVADAAGFAAVDGVLFDLGVSSEQLDTPGRGFSFALPGPLDMRLDPGQTLTAAEIVNACDERELADLLREAGDEPEARRIARAIVRARTVGPITTTTQLAAIVRGAKRAGRRHLDPATRSFLALRVATNREMAALAQGLAAALDVLRPGGRLAVIAFHAGEDRLVKNFLRRHAGRWEAQAAGGRTWVAEQPEVRLITRKPVIPTEAEVADNPRARSARLRVAARKDDHEQQTE